jgi:hypothetical protein
MNQAAKNQRKIFIGYAVDILGPLAAYWLTRKLGIPIFWGLALGGVIAIISTAFNSIRHRRLDAVGILVLLELVTSIVLLFYLNDPRLLLIRPSIYTGVAAIYLMANAFSSQPVSFQGSRAIATGGDPIRTAAFEQAWKDLPQFRRAHKMLTFGWGIASMVDSILRVVIVYRFPIDRAVWLSNLPHTAAIVIMLGVSALFGRWAGTLVDGVQQKLVSHSSSPAL